MNKTAAILTTLALSLSLAACGNGNDDKKDDKNENKTEKSVDKSDNSKKSAIGFKDDTLTIEQGIIKLKKSEIVDTSEGKSIVITFDYTNKSDEPQEAFLVFLACFNLTQEDDTAVHDLETAVGLYDVEGYNQLDKNVSLSIKPGKTIEGAVAYTLKDDKSDVTLTATQGAMGDKLGTKTYKIK